MKSRISKIFAILTCFVMLFTATISSNVFASTDGKTFNENQLYQLDKTIPTTLPQTVEAWVKLPKSVSGRGGVILGNYEDSSIACFSIEIFENGVPRLYCAKGSTKKDYQFSGADIRSDSWTHLAITWSGTTATCYINGENKGSVTASMPSSWEMSNPLCVGGDLRSNNGQYFKGSIKQVAVYKDVRTQAEIQADMNALATTDSEMLMAFDLSTEAYKYEDLSSNGYVLETEDPMASLDPNLWLTADQIDIPENYDFSFMAIGDTQIVTRYDANGLVKIYDYVVNNVESKKVKHVMGLGDITDADKDWEWDRAKVQIARMDGVVPYSIVRGNHDIYSAGRNMKVISTYDKIYGSTDSAYAKQYTYCYDYPNAGEELFRARNTVHFFSSETRDYMVVALDYGASDDVLRWAGEIITAFPNHNVIITTHNYLNTDGTTADKGEGTVPSRDYNSSNSYGINDGKEMWDEFVSQYKNIVLVLSGHKPCDQIVMTQRQGVHGNVVTEFLIDPQGMDVDDSKGMVATFYVDENGEDVTVEWYSTIKNAYYKKSNNYSFKINTIERGASRVVSFNANGGSGEMDSVEMRLVKYDLPECTFTAPSDRYEFKGWSLTPNGDVITSTTINIESSTTLYAVWQEKEFPKYKVSVTGGVVLTESLCEEGEIVTVKANEPEKGKRFTNWYGANGLNFIEGNASSTEITFKMPARAVTLIATYEDAIYKISASAGANGKISKSGQVSVKEGEDYTFTFTPNQGYKIKDVLVNGESIGAVESYTFENVTEDSTIFVSFEKIAITTYAITVNGGTVTPANECEEGTIVTVTANNPVQGKRFAGWEGLEDITLTEGNSSTMVIMFAMPSKAVTLTATYEDITYTISASAGANGNISTTGQVTVKEGEDYTFTFTPNQGYEIKDVLVNGESIGAVESYTFENITENATISVEFAEIIIPTYAITVNGGTVTPANECEEGTIVTVTANNPEQGKRFTGWEGLKDITLTEGNSSTMVITFAMPSKAVTLTATYEDITYTISASAGANGNISTTGQVTVKEGEDYTFTFTPNQGYKVKAVLVNGVSIGAVESYTFENITANATISVEFEEVITETEPTTPNSGGNSSSSGCGSSADAGSATLLATLSLALAMVLKRIKG